MAIPVLSYGCELWTATKKEESTIQTSEMAFLRGLKRYSKLDHTKNGDIREELQVFSLNEGVKHYKQWWKNVRKNLEIMSDLRLAKQVWIYKPIGHRYVGRPRKLSLIHI